MTTTAWMSSWFGPFGPWRRPRRGENNTRYFRFLNRFVDTTRWRLQNDRGPEDARLADEEGEQTGGDAIGGAQVGRTLAPVIEDQQLMPSSADSATTERSLPRPPGGYRDDHMNKQEDEVAHGGHGNNTSQVPYTGQIGNSP
jgi:hypothetical protein